MRTQDVNERTKNQEPEPEHRTLRGLRNQNTNEKNYGPGSYEEPGSRTL